MFGTHPKPGRSTVFHGLSADAELGTFTNCLDNARAAVLARVLFKKQGKTWTLASELVPDRKECLARIEPFISALESNLVGVAGKLQPMSRKEYAEQYSGGKRKIYEAALQSLELRPIDRDDSTIKGFIKVEKDIRSDKPGRIPRVISPPSARYRLETGIFVKPAEHEIYRAIDQTWGFQTVTKGLNYDQVAELFRSGWDSFVNPVGFDADVKRMDQATSWGIPMTNGIVSRLFGGSDRKYIADLLMWQEQYSVRIVSKDGMISYRCETSLTSGQTNTSLVGVTQINGLVWLFCKHHQIRIRYINAGDDMSIICESKDVDFIRREIGPWFEQFGMELEIGPVVKQLEHFEFCQTRPVKIGGKWRMVRDPRTVSIKDACSLKHLASPKLRYAHLRAVGTGGLAAFGDVPILGEFYAALVREADRIKTDGKLSQRQNKSWEQAARKYEREDGSLKWYGHGMDHSKGGIDPAGRVSFMEAFGVIPAAQQLLESHYRGWRLLPEEVDPRLNVRVKLL